MVTVYGIKNCDTCRKALAWLEAEGIPYKFHDFRKDGLDPGKVAQWVNAIDMDILVNKRGTTYRQLPENCRKFGKDADSITLLASQPTLMKRPIFEIDDRFELGFKPPVQAILKQKAGLDFPG